MTSTVDPWFVEDLGDNAGKMTFQNLDSAKFFFQNEMQHYNWINKFEDWSEFASTVDFISKSLNTTIYGLDNPSQFGEPRPFLSYQISTIYGMAKLPIIESIDGEFLENLRKTYDDETAMAYLAYTTDKAEGIPPRKSSLRGAIIACQREQGIGAYPSVSKQDSLNELYKKLLSQFSDMEVRFSDQAHFFEVSNKKTRLRLEAQRRWDVRNFQRFMNSLNKKFDAAIDDFEQTKKTYEELMKLKAPVDYWQEKAKKHRASAEKYKGALMSHFKWLGPSLIALLILIALISYFTADPAKPIIAQFVFAAIGVLLTTVAFWAARIIVRLYMSEHHLAIDAEERATMAMTYLALIERGAAEEKDRALVLAPLFRPTSDGIVKDDAAPEFSPAAIASKYLTR